MHNRPPAPLRPYFVVLHGGADLSEEVLAVLRALPGAQWGRTEGRDLIRRLGGNRGLLTWSDLDCAGTPLILLILEDDRDASELLAQARQLGGKIVTVPRLGRQFGDQADLICAVEEWPQRLPELCEGALGERARQQILEHLPEIYELLQAAEGHDFRHYRQAFCVRRIERRMGFLQLRSVIDYLERLRQPDELRRLFNDLLVGVTQFFRDPESFEALREPLLAQLRAHGQLRIWSAGCASGEEAYSLAMLLLELAREAQVGDAEVKVLATDLDEEALAQARVGRYPAQSVAPVGEARLSRYFVGEGDTYRVSRQLRQVCQFSQHNLVTDPPFIEIDLVVCRNVLIYLSAPLQEKLLPLFHYSLRPQGYLWLGSSETVGESSALYRLVDEKARLYQRLEGASQLVLANLELPQRYRTRPARAMDMTELVSTILAEEFTPRALVVNQEGSIVWSSGRLEHLFRFPLGNFQNQVVQLARKGLRNLLRSALLQAVGEQRTVTVSGVRLEDNEEGPACLLDLTVQPMPEMGAQTGLYLVVLQDRPMLPQDATPGVRHDSRLFEVERDLARVSDELDRTVQELESANEELKSSNEELWAMNEELRVTNEELEKSRADAEHKNQLLLRANLDLSHLLTSTNLPAVFLDFEQRILRYTPSVTRIYPLIESDLGRPLWQVRDQARLMPAISNRVEEWEECEIELLDGGWFLRKIAPYADSEGTPLGVVVTFSDISELRRSRGQLDESLRELRAVYNHAPVGLAVLDSELQVTRENRFFRRSGLREGLPEELLEAAREALASQQPRQALQFSLGSASERTDFEASLHPQEASVHLVVEDVSLLKQRERESAWKAAALQASADLVAIVDRDGRNLFLNRSGRELLGYQPDEAVLAPLEDLIAPKQRRLFRREVLEAARGPGWSGELRLLRRSGGELPVELSLFRPEEDAEVLVCVAQDCSRLRRLEEQLGSHRQEWHDLFELMPFGISIVDRDYTILYANQRARRAWAVDFEATGRTVREISPEWFGSPFQEAFDQAARGKPRTLEGYFESRRSWYVARYLPVPQGVFVLFEDITARKQMDLRSREMVLAVTSSSDFIAICDPDLTIRFVNPAGSAMSGYTESELVGRSLAGLLELLPEREGESETSLRTAGGEELPVTLSVQPFRGEQEELLGYCGIARDIRDIRRREDELRQSESRFRQAFAAAPMPVLIFAEDGELLAASDFLLQVTGYRFEEIQRLPHWLLVAHREHADAVRGHFESWLGQLEQPALEVPIWTRQGEKRIWKLTGTSAGILDDSRRYAVIMAEDLTERIRREEALEEGALFLRRTLDSLPLFAAVLNIHGVLVEVNRVALEVAGLSPDQVLGQPFEETYWWAHDPAVQADLRRAILRAAAGEPVRYDVEVRVGEGRLITVDFQIAPMRDRDGKVTHLLPSGLDVTERREIERSRQADQERFRALLNSTAEAIYGIDLECRVTFANPACLNLLGLEHPEQILGRQAHTLMHPVRPDGEAYPDEDCPLVQSLREQKSVHVPLDYFRRADGRFFPVECWSHPEFVGDKMVGCVVNFFDISERLEVARELSEAKQAAEGASRAKSDFLANMSHEIRTPMAAILGYVEILLNQTDDPDNVECLRVIQRNGSHLLEIINDILDLSKIEAGRLRVEQIPVAIQAVVAEVISLMAVTAREKDLKLEVCYQGLIPETISSDPTRLRQVLMNLLSNALKFSQTGFVRLHIRLQAERQLVEFAVEDTGLGISAEQLGRLFRPFSQADTSVTRRFGGTGLGLVISRRLAELLGGTLTATSEEGVGSVFSFTVATGDLQGVALVDPHSWGGGTVVASGASEMPDLSGLEVLVVDDRRDIRYLVQSYLEEAGARVDTAGDGQAALSYLSRCRPDLVVLDMQMPTLDGYSTARQIRAERNPVPILALTASAMKQDRETCMEAGCDGYLSKPVDRAALIHQVYSLSRLRRGLRVLIVEDNPMAAAALQAILGTLGCHCEVAASGRQAQASLRQNPADFAWIDLGLPDMDGWDLLRQLRAVPELDGCRMVAHTGRSPDEVVPPEPDLKFDFMVQKPATREVITRVLFGSGSSGRES